MKGERKRKRAGKVEQSRADGRIIKSKGREVAVEKVAAEAVPSPTQEEVDEFFAILRRMRVAVKYFEKGDFNTKGGGGGGRLQDPTRTPEAAAGGSYKAGGKRVGEDRGLDLNAAPDQAE